MPFPRRPLTALLIPFLFAAPAAAAPTHGLALHGQPNYPADFPHFDYVNPQAPKGGAVRLDDTGAFDTLNGFVLKGNAAPGLDLIYDTLTAHALDEPSTEYAQLSETLDLAPDQTHIIHRLRPEARWHDGQPITAHDVVFTLNRLKSQGHPFFRSYYADVEKAEALDARTVRFDFAPGANRELALIVGQMAILPKHYWQNRDFDKTTLEPPLGSGPYRIADVKPGRSITYERVAEYWGRDLPINRGRHNIQTIRYDVYRDRTVSMEAFKAGELDFRAENSSKNWATAYDIPAVRDGRIVKEEVDDHSPQGMQGFVFNLRRPQFQDRRTREAIGLAFDFEWSNRQLFHNAYTRTRSYFSNSELAAVGLPSEAELTLLEPFRDQLPAEVFTHAYAPPQTRGDGRIRRQLRQAAGLLKKAGWRVREGRLHNAEGQPFRFQILLVSPLFERIALPFKRNLERLGMDVDVRIVDTPQYVNRIRAFDYDMIVMSFGQSLSPGNEQRAFWTTEAADIPGSRNYPGLKHPAADALVNHIIAAETRADLTTACRALDRVLQWQFLVVPHWHTTKHRLAYWSKLKRPAHPPPYGLPLDLWWIEE